MYTNFTEEIEYPGHRWGRWRAAKLAVHGKQLFFNFYCTQLHTNLRGCSRSMDLTLARLRSLLLASRSLALYSHSHHSLIITSRHDHTRSRVYAVLHHSLHRPHVGPRILIWAHHTTRSHRSVHSHVPGLRLSSNQSDAGAHLHFDPSSITPPHSSVHRFSLRLHFSFLPVTFFIFSFCSYSPFCSIMFRLYIATFPSIKTHVNYH
jgi:hypothetical protein